MADSSVTENGALADGDTRRRIWAIVGASSGNLVEWFDFYIYSFCSLYFAHIFFHLETPPRNSYKLPAFLLQAF